MHAPTTTRARPPIGDRWDPPLRAVGLLVWLAAMPLALTAWGPYALWTLIMLTGSGVLTG